MKTTGRGAVFLPYEPAFKQREERIMLRESVRHPRIMVGEYTYYDAPQGTARFAEENVCYLDDAMDDRLLIGKFCAIGAHVRFLMNGANHRLYSAATYPFQYVGDFRSALPAYAHHTPSRGDTIVGNDVWIGRESLIMPGSQIGDGAVIAAGAVVTGIVPPYAVVAGVPARIVHMRLDEELSSLLLRYRWWDLPLEEIRRILPVLCSGRLDDVKAFLRRELCAASVYPLACSARLQ